MSTRAKKRFLSGSTLLGAIVLQAGIASAGRARLVVFVQTVIKQRALQAMLQAALPGLSITAVGRVADFDRALEDAPDAVLTLPVVMHARGMTPLLRGTRGGLAEETYALIGVDAPPELSGVSTVGALDLLGRDGTNAFVRDLLGSDVKVERVTKVEDLLPLLQMQRADAVLVPTRMFSEIESTSSLHLARTVLSRRVGLPAIAGIGAGGRQAVDQTVKLTGESAKVLGVDSWQ